VLFIDVSEKDKVLAVSIGKEPIDIFNFNIIVVPPVQEIVYDYIGLSHAQLGQLFFFLVIETKSQKVGPYSCLGFNQIVCAFEILFIIFKKKFVF
jgi:hypothetical protein